MTQCAKIIAGFVANVGNVFYPTFTYVFFIFSTFFTFFNVFFYFYLNVYYIYVLVDHEDMQQDTTTDAETSIKIY